MFRMLDRWMHSWKGGPESWHRLTESLVISPPPRSQWGSISINHPSFLLSSKKPCSSCQKDFSSSTTFLQISPLHYKSKLSPPFFSFLAQLFKVFIPFLLLPVLSFFLSLSFLPPPFFLPSLLFFSPLPPLLPPSLPLHLFLFLQAYLYL